MNDYLYVLLLALLPAFGNFAGGIVAEVVPVSPRILNLALHVASGIVIAVVGVEIMAEALEVAPAWIIVLGFCLGGLFSIGLDASIEALRRGRKSLASAQSRGSGAWMIYIAVATDLFSDGLLVGTGSSISLGLALVLALGQLLADVPEGFAAIATFKGENTTRTRRLVLSASFALPVLIGATIGYWLLRGQGEAIKYAALAFVAGLLAVAAVEEMIGEAHEAQSDSRLSAAAFTGGFALFTFVSASFEG